MPTVREIRRAKQKLTPAQELKQLRAENKNMREAMDVIRFLSFQHEVQYWKDASGTDREKLDSILDLARESNWAVDGSNENEEIRLKHTK